jgi:hypothetical protein
MEVSERGVTKLSACEAIDFDNAAVFLQQAKEAHERGDHVGCIAAVKLVKIALNLTDGVKPAFRTKHLKSG